ncbi:hypothetical protein CTEN210_04259 [Chaetoceros tenuissimus]|uniref:Uncharacterized protein n=1 Tax=Chaetoceros tenuissimus TaxID=426638 RepID=A0AAD3CLB0_9STRA|nr:hypothetical protein CTEN210_04259 [Chaetoceros tenuissimus]
MHARVRLNQFQSKQQKQMNRRKMRISSSLSKQHSSKQRLPKALKFITAILLLGFITLMIQMSVKKPTYTANENKCWIKKAISSHQLKLFSHRTFSNANLETQPTCEESLFKLKEINVNHFDVDLVLNGDELIVAHPMEFKRESSYYAPCSNLPIDDFLSFIQKVFTKDEDYFISFEPKAAWDNTAVQLEDKALTNLPSDILLKFQQAMQKHDMKHHCAAIVDIRTTDQTSHPVQEIEKQKEILKEILQMCLHFSGIRISDPVPQSTGVYDYIMPTIEFHPNHPHNPYKASDNDGNKLLRTGKKKTIPDKVLKKSILWVVDTAQDLEMAAELRPYGIVSNVPLVLNELMKQDSWCE